MAFPHMLLRRLFSPLGSLLIATLCHYVFAFFHQEDYIRQEVMTDFSAFLASWGHELSRPITYVAILPLAVVLYFIGRINLKQSFIHVRLKDGRTGTVSEKDFDPNTMTKL